VAGARRGAASQLAGWGALTLALLSAWPGAHLFGPTFAAWLHAPPGTASVAAGFATFIFVLVVGRLVLDTLLRGVLTFGDPEHQGVNRALGFLLGAGKVLAIAWVSLSALAFVETRFSVSTRALGLAPEKSLAFAASRRWNLFALANLGPTQSLLRLQQALHSPAARARLSKDPAVAALLKDARFRAVSEDADLRKAMEQQDVATLLKSDAVSQLLQDPEARGKLSAALEALSGAPGASAPSATK
jgi:membrane protein required for colicin V production